MILIYNFIHTPVLTFSMKNLQKKAASTSDRFIPYSTCQENTLSTHSTLWRASNFLGYSSSEWLKSWRTRKWSLFFWRCTNCIVNSCTNLLRTLFNKTNLVRSFICCWTVFRSRLFLSDLYDEWGLFNSAWNWYIKWVIKQWNLSAEIANFTIGSKLNRLLAQETVSYTRLLMTMAVSNVSKRFV